jgi:hypothetical protein
MWKRKKKWRLKTVTTPRFLLAVSFARPACSCLLLVCFCAALGLPDVPPAIATSASQKLKPTDQYALIFGTVWGPDDHPVYGVKVKIRRVRDKKPKWELISDHVGEFAQRLPASKADYIVWADLKGLKTVDGHPLHLAQPVAVHVEYDERVDIGLHLTR